MNPASGTSRLWVVSLVACAVGALARQAARADQEMDVWRAGFLDPPMSCRPHTRWWWPGSAVTADEITWELEQMREKGLGGVEQISMGPVYEKGNIAYLSDAYLDMARHAVRTAQRLGMEISFNFGGPGWVIGGAWVPKEDRSKNLVPTFVDLDGPRRFASPLPTRLRRPHRSWEQAVPDITETDPLVAVVAGRLIGGRIDAPSLVVLSDHVEGRRLQWHVPDGRWRIIAFWLKNTGQGNTVDHFNKAAMRRYCAYLGGKFDAAFGDAFGRTVDSFFCDSFEVSLVPDGIYWSTGLLEAFRDHAGYDLTRYLPAIWWDVGPLTSKVRYDVNAFLHQVGLDAFFGTFLAWCDAHGVQGRIQPYGFTTDNIRAAGLTHIPEMEITAGEKDAVPWFDTRIGPKKYVASGAHLYGRNLVTAEAYTFLHWEAYRATLEELKIAGDVYFRNGANKLYNHGYQYLPERDVAPSRTFGAAIGISHPNIWWRYYPRLAGYLARCCFMLRHGHFVADVALYSPLANQWTRDVLNARRWTRDFDWGELGRLLVANGYDFDLVNDDVLQHRARIANGSICVRELAYKLLILPNVEALPLETFEFVQRYVQQGGTAIALEQVPTRSVGLVDCEAHDRRVKTIGEEMFNAPGDSIDAARRDYGKGRTYCIRPVMDRRDVLDRRSSALDPFLNMLRARIPPDFGIDFALEGLRENNGLTFVHRRTEKTDLYFVTNIQDRPSGIPVTFRVKGRVPWRWDPYRGRVSRIFRYRQMKDGTQLPLRLAPYESTFILFSRQEDAGHVLRTDLDEIVRVTRDTIEARASRNGTQTVTLVRGGRTTRRSVVVDDLPAPLRIDGTWQLTLESDSFPGIRKTLTDLASWTTDPATRHFSGTGRYETRFDVPETYTRDNLELRLDLGRVGNVAEVRLNDTEVGTVWMRGQTLDVTAAARAGANHLVVLVTNTLINRVSAFTAPRPVPDRLVARYGHAARAFALGGHSPIGFKALPASGLMGPVELVARKKVSVAVR